MTILHSPRQRSWPADTARPDADPADLAAVVGEGAAMAIRLPFERARSWKRR